MTIEPRAQRPPAPRPAEPCRHPSYIRNIPELPPGMTRCSNVHCGQVFLYLERTGVCAEAVYADTELEARRMHAQCAGYVVTPRSRCECPCHGTRLVAPARPTKYTIHPDSGKAFAWTWETRAATVYVQDKFPVGVFTHSRPQHRVNLRTLAELDALVAALVAARRHFTQEPIQ